MPTNVLPVLTKPSELIRYAWEGAHKPIGDLWFLSNDGQTLRCYVVTHYYGWQLRMELNDKVLRAQTCRTEFDVFDVSERLRKRAETNGWTSRPATAPERKTYPRPVTTPITQK